MTLQFSDFYYGLRPLLDESKIKDYCKKSRHFDSKHENIINSKTLILFSGEERKSWLVRTNLSIYKLLDNRREPNPLINWAIALSEISDFEVFVEPRSKGRLHSLKFSFRDGKDYLVDPSLFQNLSIEKTISAFIKGSHK